MITVKDTNVLRLYLYSRVVVPMKQVDIDFTSMESPIEDRDGRKYAVSIRSEPIIENLQYRYQRAIAGRTRDYQVIIGAYDSGIENVIARIDRKHKSVVLYAKTFEDMGATHLLGVFHEVFYTNRPFTKVTIENVSVPPRTMLDTVPF